MRIMLNAEKITLTFPSPIGELHFSMIFFMSKQMLIHRFRLLSGSYISQFGYSVFCIKLSPMFPSPIGELHFSIGNHICRTEICFRVSVPYRGATFLNRCYKQSMVDGKGVSVPYRGATFLNGAAEELGVDRTRGFRPLSGSYISQ